MSNDLMVVDQNTGEIVAEGSGVESSATRISEAMAVARVQKELEASIISAKKFPRNEAEAYAKVMQRVSRPGLAKKALYSFPRGGKSVTGPSVHLARTMAQCWGNIESGVRVVSSNDETCQLQGYAYDFETNFRTSSEATFKRLVQRKDGWREPDEREFRELANKHGAILERNAILKIIPADIVEAAADKARVVCAAAAKGELKANREDVVRQIVMSFSEVGISQEQAEKYLGKPLKAITEEDVVNIRALRQAISDGDQTALEKFTRPSDELNKKIDAAAR